MVDPRAIIEARCTLDSDTGCWLWKLAKGSDGYGRLGKKGRAHRAAFEAYKGPIPAGLIVCHTCDTPACVNPEHLFLGTHSDNARDRERKKRGRALRMAGETHASARLTAADVAAIRADSRPHRAIAEQYGVSVSHVSHIRSGSRWKAEAAQQGATNGQG